MYETGRGVEKNLDEALKWYLKSSKKNNKSAKRRITYIDILKNGFKKPKHTPWLQELTQDAKYKDGDASLLLGLLYKEGVIVKQDLEKSLVLLKQAVVKNISSAEDELESVKVLMEEEKKLALLKRQQAEQKQKAIADAERKKRQLELSRIKNNKIQKQKQKQKQKEQAAKNKARYEKKRSVNKAALVSTQQVDRKVEKTKPIEIKHQPSWAEAVELQRLKEEAGND